MSDVEARMAALCRRFAESAEQQAAALRIALQTGDRQHVQKIAHHLAGASGIFGHRELGEDSLRLEEALDSGASLARIEPLANDVLTRLDTLFQSR